MRVSPYEPETEPPRDERDKPRATADALAAAGGVRAEEANPGRDESLEEPGYGHGV